MSWRPIHDLKRGFYWTSRMFLQTNTWPDAIDPFDLALAVYSPRRPCDHVNRLLTNLQWLPRALRPRSCGCYSPSHVIPAPFSSLIFCCSRLHLNTPYFYLTSLRLWFTHLPILSTSSTTALTRLYANRFFSCFPPSVDSWVKVLKEPVAHGGLGSVQRDLRVQGPPNSPAGTRRMPKAHAEPAMFQQIPIKYKVARKEWTSAPRGIHGLLPSFRCYLEKSEWQEKTLKGNLKFLNWTNIAEKDTFKEKEAIIFSCQI